MYDVNFAITVSVTLFCRQIWNLRIFLFGDVSNLKVSNVVAGCRGELSRCRLIQKRETVGRDGKRNAQRSGAFASFFVFLVGAAASRTSHSKPKRHKQIDWN